MKSSTFPQQQSGNTGQLLTLLRESEVR